MSRPPNFPRVSLTLESRLRSIPRINFVEEAMIWYSHRSNEGQDTGIQAPNSAEELRESIVKASAVDGIEETGGTVAGSAEGAERRGDLLNPTKRMLIL